MELVEAIKAARVEEERAPKCIRKQLFLIIFHIFQEFIFISDQDDLDIMEDNYSSNSSVYEEDHLGNQIKVGKNGKVL